MRYHTLQYADMQRVTETSFHHQFVCIVTMAASASSSATAAASHLPQEDKEEGTVTVLFFASVRQVMGGLTELEVAVPLQCDTTRFRVLLAERHPALRPFLLGQDDDADDGKEGGPGAAITLALNEEYVPQGEVWPVRPGDTVALIPPISGG